MKVGCDDGVVVLVVGVVGSNFPKVVEGGIFLLSKFY